MLVKNMMVLGKLFLILVCTNSYAQSWESPINQRWHPNESSVQILINLSRYFSTQLKPQDKELHRHAVYHALNNLENGEVAEWFNDRTDAQGKVRIVMTTPANGSYCRRVHSWVRLGSEDRAFEDTACYNVTTKTWNFYK
jgi:surface antigen